MRFFATIIFAFFIQSTTFAQVGSPAPDFTVTDTHGETHRLYDYLEAGKVVVLDFFYTTCGPCQYYSPQVNLAYEKYGCNRADVIFIAIDYNDNDAQVLAYDQQYQIQYPSVSGLNGGGNAVVSAYHIFAFPTFYVIDSTKTVIDQITPPTLQVFDFRFQQHGIQPAACDLTGLDEKNDLENWKFFPNPLATGSRLSVQLEGQNDSPMPFEIFNIFGKRVLIGEVMTNGSQTLEINTAGLSAGLYHLKMNARKGTQKYCGVFVIQ